MPHLAIIIPTLNEIENIDPLIQRLDTVLAGIDWELIFVDDDSSDGTAEHIRAISLGRPQIRVIQRIGRSGLASACVEGMLASSAPYIAVMDADMQHDEAILPQMIHLLRSNSLDIVVGSRHAGEGSMGTMGPRRQWLSRLGARISFAVCHCHVSDPMSGYFVLTRAYLESVVYRLSNIGFKILVDLLASSTRPVRMAEVPYHFRSRLHGQSKLDISTGIEYFLLIADKLLGNIAPARFVGFVLVGSIGLILNLLVVSVAYRWFGLPFLKAQAVAAFAAMVSNFFINNITTYRDLRLRRWRMLQGLVVFCIACAVGALANIGIAGFLVERGVAWYLAASFGLMIGAVWNYGATYVFTWRMLRSHRRFLQAVPNRAVEKQSLPAKI